MKDITRNKYRDLVWK